MLLEKLNELGQLPNNKTKLTGGALYHKARFDLLLRGASS